MEKIIDSEEIVREFTTMDEKNEYKQIIQCYQLFNKYHSQRQKIIIAWAKSFVRLYEIINSGTKTGNNDTDNQIELINGMKVYQFLSNVFNNMKKGYTINLFGGWLVRVLSGLNIVGGDLDLYVTPKISKSEIVTILDQISDRRKYLFGLKSYSLIFQGDNKYIKFGGGIDIDCYQLVFTNGIKCDLLTNRPDDSCVDFNVNQLVFTKNGINRKVQTGNGCDWGSIFLGLYTKTGTTVKNYDKSTSLENLEVSERHHVVQMVSRYQKMLAKGLTINNFNPPIESDGSIIIECGHKFDLEVLRKYVRQRLPWSSQCPSCFQSIVVRLNQ